MKAVEKRYPGIDRVICGTPARHLAPDLDRFAKEAIPAFRDTGSPPRDGWPEGRLTGILVVAILYGMSDLIPELARLSPGERLDLIEVLRESLDDKDVPVTEAQQAELARRIAGFEQDREPSISWDQLSAELRQRR